MLAFSIAQTQTHTHTQSVLTKMFKCAHIQKYTFKEIPLSTGGVTHLSQSTLTMPYEPFPFWPHVYYYWP